MIADMEREMQLLDREHRDAVLLAAERASVERRSTSCRAVRLVAQDCHRIS